jgi:hypothetical protein
MFQLGSVFCKSLSVGLTFVLLLADAWMNDYFF